MNRFKPIQLLFASCFIFYSCGLPENTETINELESASTNEENISEKEGIVQRSRTSTATIRVVPNASYSGSYELARLEAEAFGPGFNGVYLEPETNFGKASENLFYNANLYMTAGTRFNVGIYQYNFQSDGNFVCYKNGAAIWATGTQNSGARYLYFQGDGNMVLYRNNGTGVVWSSNTFASPEDVASFNFQNDGNLIINTDGRDPDFVAKEDMPVRYPNRY